MTDLTKDGTPVSLITVGNLPERTRYTFGNSIRGARKEFGSKCAIRRVIVLDTEQSIEGTDERSRVIRDVLGRACAIESVPCLDDFASQAFETLASELLRKNYAPPIVDITNGRRFETFSLIVATSLSRVENVISTSVPVDLHGAEYSAIGDEQLSVIRVGPFPRNRLLEAAAKFEMIYYSDIVRECVRDVRGVEESQLKESLERAEEYLEHSILRYFSDDPRDFQSALSRISLLVEEIARALAQEFASPSEARLDFVDANNLLRKKIEDTRKVKGSNEDYARAMMLHSLLEYARNSRNLVQHPHRKENRGPDVRFLIFLVMRMLDQIPNVTSYLRESKET